MSLRTVHLIFILIAIIMAELFGAWALNEYRAVGDGTILALGIVTLLGGLALVPYAWWFVIKMDKAHIE